MRVYIGGKQVVLSPKDALGKGGEADVFRWGADMAVKVMKSPEHPDLLTDADRQAARARIDEHQKKLPAFPKGLPPRIVAPIDLAKDSKGRILGYVMRLVQGAEPIRYLSDPSFRKQVDGNKIVAVLRDWRGTFAGCHAASPSLVIGDVNDLNTLVVIDKGEAWQIDADSAQFGPFVCKVFTERFVDPRLCDQGQQRPVLVKRHDPDSDWFAFAAILMQSLVCCHPFGGVYKPKDPAKRIPPTRRPIDGVSVFDPEVIYPKPAIPYAVLPDDLLHHLEAVFSKKRLRGEFPERLLDIRWTKCTKCGAEHARNLCPECAEAAPAAVKEKITVRGKVKSDMFFRTPGVILQTAVVGSKLAYLLHENGKFKREDGSEVMPGTPDPRMRYRIDGRRTFIGKGTRVVVFDKDARTTIQCSSFRGHMPMYDVSGAGAYWIENGTLVKEHDMGLEYGTQPVGGVLDDQTLFWVGDDFGFGFYSAGEVMVSFVFEAKSRGLNDSVPLPAFGGQLVATRCFFSGNRAYFFASISAKGRMLNRCFVVRRDGTVAGSAEGEEGDGTWLGSIRGKCVIGNMVLSPTDAGIIRTDMDDGKIVREATFPDTDSFVSEETKLHPAPNGIYAVGRKSVQLLQMS